MFYSKQHEEWCFTCTRKRKGRANNDRRSLVQSVVISSMPSTQQRLNAKERQLTVPWSVEIAKFLGMNPRTFQQIKQKVQHKRDLLEQVTNGILKTGTVFSQVVKSKGWTKVNKDLTKIEEIRSIHSLKIIQMSYRVRSWMIMSQWNTKLIHQ